MTKVSIIIPAYNEEGIIADTIATLESVVDQRPEDFEYIVVDDGSSDKTWHILSSLPPTKHPLRGISFSKNFGKEAAIAAGLKKASGDAAIIMDCDLQHPPATIPDLLDTWQKTESDIVNATKEGRQNESVRNSLPVRIFYRVHHFFTGSSLTNASDFKLITRPVIDTYNNLGEQALFFRGIIPTLGFKQEEVKFSVTRRENGDSKWNSVSRAKLGLRAIFAFSVLPLQLVTIMGVLFLISSLILGAQTLLMWWSGAALDGFTTVIILLLIIGAVIMISLGIIGQYIAFIYDEVRGRPRYIVHKTLNKDARH
tara:strand:+ start:36017 stop:36952 length:936 start_codon:yes stop_codon:yes gene_type:complete